MLRLTEEASAHLKGLRRSRRLPDDAVPRFERQDGRLRLMFARRPSAGDQLVSDRRMPVLVAANARDLLESATIELRSSAGKLRLAVKRGGGPAGGSSDGGASRRGTTKGEPGRA